MVFLKYAWKITLWIMINLGNILGACFGICLFCVWIIGFGATFQCIWGGPLWLNLILVPVLFLLAGRMLNRMESNARKKQASEQIATPIEEIFLGISEKQNIGSHLERDVTYLPGTFKLPDGFEIESLGDLEKEISQKPRSSVPRQRRPTS